MLLKLTTSINVNDLCVNSDNMFCSDLKVELIMNKKKILVVGANKCHVIWMNSQLIFCNILEQLTKTFLTFYCVKLCACNSL